MTPARTVLGATRALIGIGAWTAPDLTVRVFGMDPDQSDRFVGRLFGSREFTLAASLLAAPPALLAPVALIGAAVDTADADGGLRRAASREPLDAGDDPRADRGARVRRARRPGRASGLDDRPSERPASVRSRPQAPAGAGPQRASGSSGCSTRRPSCCATASPRRSPSATSPRRRAFRPGRSTSSSTTRMPCCRRSPCGSWRRCPACSTRPSVAAPAPTGPATVDRVVDAYADMIREHPAIRRLWLSGLLDTATRRVERETDATIAARLGALLRDQAGTRRGTAEQWRTLVALIDGLLRHAFTDDPAGDPAALREARRAARAYAASVLGDRRGLARAREPDRTAHRGPGAIERLRRHRAVVRRRPRRRRGCGARTRRRPGRDRPEGRRPHAPSAPPPPARRASAGPRPRTSSCSAPGRASYSTDAVVTKHPPGKTPSRRWAIHASTIASRRGRPAGRRRRREPDRRREPPHGGREHGALERLLVAEAPDQPALAHRELAGEAPDRDALEPLDAREVDRGGHRGRAAVGDVGGGAARHDRHDTGRTIVRYNSGHSKRGRGRCD